MHAYKNTTFITKKESQKGNRSWFTFQFWCGMIAYMICSGFVSNFRLCLKLMQSWNQEPFLDHRQESLLESDWTSERERETERERERKEAIMVIAALPFDKRHVVSLWSELECFVGSASHVVISSAYWAMPIIESILLEARKNIPKFANIKIEARYFDNQRYDVGLWCDALQGLYSYNKYGYFMILNDSIFALREFDGILDALRSPNNFSFVSLNGNENDKRAPFWLESVFRGFDELGLSIFLKNSCVPQDDESFCRNKIPVKRKRCIVEHHEIDLVGQFPDDANATGLYNGKVPDHMSKGRFPTWTGNVPYWREVLVKKQQFPAAKVKEFQMIASIEDPIISNCTRYLNRTFVDVIAFTYNSASLPR